MPLQMSHSRMVNELTTTMSMMKKWNYNSLHMRIMSWNNSTPKTLIPTRISWWTLSRSSPEILCISLTLFTKPGRVVWVFLCVQYYSISRLETDFSSGSLTSQAGRFSTSWGIPSCLVGNLFWAMLRFVRVIFSSINWKTSRSHCSNASR